MRPTTLLELVVLAMLWSGAAHAGPWTLGNGELAVKGAVGLWTTDRKYASSLDEELTFVDRNRVARGDRIPFDPSTGGRLTAVSMETQVQLGLLPWLDVGMTVPLLLVNFDTEPVDAVDSRFGLGDIVLSTQAMVPADLPVALAARLEVKLPTGDFDPSVFSAPLTEGQLDVTAWASVGFALPARSWVSADVGYRLRFENPDNNFEPGDELLFFAEAGAHIVSGLSGKLAIDGLVGRDGSIDRFGAQTVVPRRRAFSVWLAAWWAVADNLWIEAAGRWIFAGEDYPAGFQTFVGARGTLQVFGVDK